MSKPKFTPGPLEVDFYNIADIGIYTVNDSLNQAVCKCYTQYPFADKPGITDEEAEGNAFLYAAAPEMYAELERIADILEDPEDCGEISLDRINAILRKARGESEELKAVMKETRGI